MPTAHNEAQIRDIAKIVLTSGDPKRCEYIAQEYLTNVRLVNSVRGMTAYTGEYKGKEITIFPAGMGMASMGIYCYELFKFYNVETIIRIGTCGTINPTIEPLDLLLLNASYTESNFAFLCNQDANTHLALASDEINQKINLTAQEMNLGCITGTGLCNEVFDPYLPKEQFQAMLNRLPKNLQLTGTEMEAFALFYIAKMLNKKAACLLTVVDSIYKPDVKISAMDRQTKLNNMIEIALNTSLKL